MSKKDEVEVIDLYLYEDEIDKKEVFLEHIENISQKTKINKDVLSYFINNNGSIEDIFKGISIINDENSENGNCKLILSNNLKLKDNVINENMLYNISHYCVLNNFKATNLSEDPYKVDVFHINNKLFKKGIMIKNHYKNSLFMKFNIKEVIPENCNYHLLEGEEDQKKLLNDMVEKLAFLNADYYNKYHYVVDIEVDLTDCLDTNVDLINDFINNVYSDYIIKIDALKIDNKKYFKKQLVQQNINKF